MTRKFFVIVNEVFRNNNWFWEHMKARCGRSQRYRELCYDYSFHPSGGENNKVTSLHDLLRRGTVHVTDLGRLRL